MTTPGLKAIARHELEVLGGTPVVARYHRDEGDEWVDILECADRPEPGRTAWATIGMSRFDIGVRIEGQDLRVEVVGLCDSRVREFGDALSSAAFNVATGDYTIEPGVIHPDVLGQYLPGTQLPHLLFVPVFSWDGPGNIEVDGSLVTWLQAVPVSETELAYARGQGSADGLQSRLAEQDVDVGDVGREPVV